MCCLKFLEKARDCSALILFSFQPFQYHWIFAYFVEETQPLQLWAVKLRKINKKNFPEPLSVTKSNCAFCLEHSYILQQKYPCKKGFLITPVSSDKIHFTRSGSPCFLFHPVPYLSFPHQRQPHLFTASNKGSKTASLCWRWAAKDGDPLILLSSQGQTPPASDSPWAAGVMPRALGPHRTLIPEFTVYSEPFPCSETPTEGQVWKGDNWQPSWFMPPLQLIRRFLQEWYFTPGCIWSGMTAWVVTRSRIFVSVMVLLFW